MTTLTRITPHTGGQTRDIWKTLIESIGKGKVKKKSNDGEMSRKKKDID
jgi:hypothetical protein